MLCTFYRQVLILLHHSHWLRDPMPTAYCCSRQGRVHLIAWDDTLGQASWHVDAATKLLYTPGDTGPLSGRC
ncbi:hypothetical protein B0T16DRAFT_416590 [Cercophora newfieldiana]|uniref:Uncharacterized protein n=1 Tax=Cercophora newfieldiana TaxID=92897 RepID=A0AA40CNC7_9PEZI|nr:hypothetical protein B0T16DRAFT_416590 [Cercophora newfieldiana]